MELQVTTTAKEPIYRQLAAQIREGVARGQLRAGERLPSVRELSRRLVINPNTVARVYTELERDGVLHTRQGLGVFIAAPTNDLTQAARTKRLLGLVDTLLTEAVHLGFGRDQVVSIVSERAEQFEWKVGDLPAGCK